MLMIDRLVLRLPDELAGRGKALGRAIGSALAQYSPSPGRARTQPAGTAVHDSTPATNDAAIAEAVVRAVAARLDGVSRQGSDGASS